MSAVEANVGFLSSVCLSLGFEKQRFFSGRPEEAFIPVCPLFKTNACIFALKVFYLRQLIYFNKEALVLFAVLQER